MTDKYNDKIIENEESYTIIENSEDDLLSYSIKDLYSDENEKKYRNKYSMRKNPPILEISSSNGDSVEFPLTKNFTENLNQNLTEVNKAYLGFKKTKQRLNMGDKDTSLKNKTKNFINVNKFLFFMFFLGVLFFIFLSTEFSIGAIFVFVLSVVIFILNYSKENNIKDERKGEKHERN